MKLNELQTFVMFHLCINLGFNSNSILLLFKGKSQIKCTFCSCRFGKTFAKQHNLFHKFYCCLSYIYHALSVLINMRRFVQLNNQVFVWFWNCSHLSFNVYCHMFDTSYQFYHSRTEVAPVYITSLFQQMCIPVPTAACFMRFSPLVRGVFCFAMRLAM